MIEKLFPHIEVAISWDEFLALPRNPAYKYEYFDGRAWLTPRPKLHHALIDFANIRTPAMPKEIAIRQWRAPDWDEMPAVFAAAFHQVQPFASLDDESRLKAAESCLQATRAGNDGPLIPDACFVAIDRSDSAVLGGILTTLSPGGNPTDWNAWQWANKPVPTENGRPHLTWIFVSPWHARRGIGVVLLEAATKALLRLGYSELGSTFLVGNESSTLWHWQAGFRLLPNPASRRLFHMQPPLKQT